MPKSCTIVLNPNTLEVTPSPGGVKEFLPREEVAGFEGIFNQKPLTATQEEWNQPYPTMTKLVVLMKNRNRDFSVELQDVTNQPTWSLGTKASLNQALADLAAWI